MQNANQLLCGHTSGNHSHEHLRRSNLNMATYMGTILSRAAVVLIFMQLLCCHSESTDAPYSEIKTVILHSSDSHTVLPNARPSPYFTFSVPQGYLVPADPQGVKVEVEVLYPSMAHFKPSIRTMWFSRTQRSTIGKPQSDVIRVSLSFRGGGDNDSGTALIRSKEKALGKWIILAPPPSNLTDRLAHLKVFRNSTTVGMDTLTYVQPDGRTVAIQCGYCTGHTTWEGRLSVEYVFPWSRLPDAADIDSKIQRLIDSFKPTYIQ